MNFTMTFLCVVDCRKTHKMWVVLKSKMIHAFQILIAFIIYLIRNSLYLMSLRLWLMVLLLWKLICLMKFCFIIKMLGKPLLIILEKFKRQKEFKLFICRPIFRSMRKFFLSFFMMLKSSWLLVGGTWFLGPLFKKIKLFKQLIRFVVNLR